jgi:hypothetical protein
MAIGVGTWVEYAGGNGSSTTVTSTAFNSTGANLLIAIATWEDTNNPTLTFSDDQTGNTWQTAIVSNATGARCGASWCVPIDTDAAHTVTCTFPNTCSFRRIAVLPVTGSFNSDDALCATSQTGSGNGTAVDAGSLVTSKASICFMGCTDYGGETFTPGTGWTEVGTATGRHAEYRIEASSGTFDPVGTIGGAQDWGAVALALGETAGGAAYNPIPTIYRYMRRTMRLFG